MTAPVPSFAVRLDKLVIDPEQNSHRELGDVAELAQVLNREGQLHPILVRLREDRRFDLIVGYRRVEATRLLGRTLVLGQEWQGTEADRLIATARENLERKDLRPYEVAMVCKRLRDEYGLTAKATAARLRISGPYTSNLLRCLDRLAPEIIEAWRCGRPDLSRLRQFAMLPLEQQPAAWLELAERGRGPSRPAPGRLDQIVTDVAVSNESDEYKRSALDALRFARGLAPGVGLINPTPAVRPAPRRRTKAAKKGRGHANKTNNVPELVLEQASWRRLNVQRNH